jgi:hypothetical protein
MKLSTRLFLRAAIMCGTFGAAPAIVIISKIFPITSDPALWGTEVAMVVILCLAWARNLQQEYIRREVFKQLLNGDLTRPIP